jgi:hypothetical protein
MDDRIDGFYLEKSIKRNMQESLHFFNKSGGYRRDNK